MSGQRKYKTQAEQFAEFVSGEPDSDRLIEVFESFREMQDEEKKKMSNALPFGKYKYKPIKDVAQFDRSYLVWLSKQDSLKKYPFVYNEVNKVLGES